MSAVHSGSGDDPDGVIVMLDSTASHSLLLDSTLELPDLAPGPHTLAVDGVGPGCTLSGPNPRDVTVIADSLVAVALEIDCADTGPGGTLVVTVKTGGVDPDSDGYAALIDTVPPEPLGLTDSITFTRLSADSHLVRLTGVADNCTIAGENPRAFRLEPLDTARIGWAITCWPPPSGRIAFVRIFGVFPFNRNVFMINADGTGLTNLTDPKSEFADEPEWSPDGERLAYVGGSQLQVLRVANRTVLVIPTGPLLPEAPHWSPDGSQLNFEALDGHVYLVAADGGSPHRPLASMDEERNAVWSPDGNRVAFIGRSQPTDPERVYVIDVNGTSPLPLSPAGLEVADRFHNIDWSPDGSRVVFAAVQPLGADFGTDLYVVAADGSGQPTNLTVSPRFSSNLRPHWSPDGLLIAYTCSNVDRSGSIGDICTLSAEGGPPTNVTRDLDFYDDFAWSPDASRLVFTRVGQEEGTTDDLFVINADGSGLVRLTQNVDEEFSPSWGR